MSARPGASLASASRCWPTKRVMIRSRRPSAERLTLPASDDRPSVPGGGGYAMTDPDFQPSASYLANPEDVHRVLLLYSGGLDTSVMLKWIQDEYQAEVVALTVNLGQPGEDYAVVEGKARQLGAVEAHVVDAREEFAHEYVL